jgi:nickel transport protein
MMHILLILLFFLTTTISPSPACAHGLKLFAVNNNGQISGQGYFVGGGPAINCQLLLQNQTGQEILQARTDAKGNFSFAIPNNIIGPHLLLLNAGPGHTARVNFDFKADDAGGAALAADEDDTRDNLPASLPTSDSQLLLAQIDRQLQNINQQLLILRAMYEPSVTFEKIIAGLGYILGLLGTAMYFHYRPRPLRGNNRANEK